jgi:hypothetical protein
MFDEDFSNGGHCSGSFCPASPEELDRLFGQDDELQPSEEECRVTAAAIALAELEVMRSQITSCAETTQTLRYLEDRIIAMGEQLDRLAGSSSSTELSAIAQSYALLEQDKGVSKLKLLEPETQPAKTYFQQQAQKPYPSFVDYFLGLQKKLLISIDSDSHEISLLFAVRPNRASFELIKSLTLFDCGWLIKQFRPSEFRFGFVRICDLKAIAWAVAVAYRELGYSCRIECGAEVIEVDELIAEASPSPIWLQLQEVPLCA